MQALSQNKHRTKRKRKSDSQVEELIKDVLLPHYRKMNFLNSNEKIYIGKGCAVSKRFNKKPELLYRMDFVAVEGRNSVLAFLTRDGKLYTAGNAMNGSLGRVSGKIYGGELGIVPFPCPEKVTSVGCGYSFTVATTRSGRAYFCGCLLNSTVDFKVPKMKLIPMDEGVHIVAVDCSNTFALLNSHDGRVFFFGTYTCLMEKKGPGGRKGYLHQHYENKPLECKLPPGMKAVQVFCHDKKGFALCRDESFSSSTILVLEADGSWSIMYEHNGWLAKAGCNNCGVYALGANGGLHMIARFEYAKDRMVSQKEGKSEMLPGTKNVKDLFRLSGSYFYVVKEKREHGEYSLTYICPKHSSFEVDGHAERTLYTENSTGIKCEMEILKPIREVLKDCVAKCFSFFLRVVAPLVLFGASTTMVSPTKGGKQLPRKRKRNSSEMEERLHTRSKICESTPLLSVPFEVWKQIAFDAFFGEMTCAPLKVVEDCIDSLWDKARKSEMKRLENKKFI